MPEEMHQVIRNRFLKKNWVLDDSPASYVSSVHKQEKKNKGKGRVKRFVEDSWLNLHMRRCGATDLQIAPRLF